jgi:hypothetical protein
MDFAGNASPPLVAASERDRRESAEEGRFPPDDTLLEEVRGFHVK